MVQNYWVPTLNGTEYIRVEDCTLALCPLDYAQVQYDPTLGGNAFYLSAFAAILLIQVIQGITSHTWTFMGAMIGGMILEIIGYAARVQLHFNPFQPNPFLIYIICLTIAPTFISAAIYLCLARVVIVYGEAYSRFLPRTYTLAFIGCDFFSLVLQAIGGALADTAQTKPAGDRGVHIMVAGLSFQVASLLLFSVLCAEFAWRVRYIKVEDTTRFKELRESTRFRASLFGLAAATIFIMIRSCFRVAELSDGFDGSLANDEVTFMILEGAMVVSASLALTIFHPGIAFAGNWVRAGYTFRTAKNIEDSDNFVEAK